MSGSKLASQLHRLCQQRLCFLQMTAPCQAHAQIPIHVGLPNLGPNLLIQIEGLIE